MRFYECLASAVDGGALSKEAADDLRQRFDEKWSQKRLELGDEAASALAKEALERELRFEAAETRRRALLTAAAQDRLKTHLQGYRNTEGKPDIFAATLDLFESFGGQAGTVGIRGKVESIVSLAHGELADVLQAFRRDILGKRPNKVLADDIAREIHGEGTGSREAKAFADAVSSVFEALRQRFNAAGGAIAKLENYFPHAHDGAALMQAGRDGWLDFIKPRLDPKKMFDPLTGEKGISGARLDQVLQATFDNITTDGWANRTPGMQRAGRGTLASQRQEHRFLVFKDASSWLEYDRQFGKGDPVVSIFQHIKGMAKDIAALETLGPNPGSMVEWLKQMNAAEFAKHKTGEPTLYSPGNGAQEFVGGSGEYLMNRIQSVYDYQRGRATVSQGVANVAGATKNWLTSAALGAGALTAAVTDPFIDALTRHISGLPVLPAFGAIFKTFSHMNESQALRAGMMLEDFMHIVRDEGRYITISSGASEFSRWIADRSLVWTGLTPITEARRHVFALDYMAAVNDHAKLSFNLLPDRFRATMEGYGIGPRDWDMMRHTPAHIMGDGAAGIIRPIDIARYDRDAAEKFLGMIYGQTERAVPTGTIRSRSLVMGNNPRGSVPGELIEGMTQFKSFGLSFTTLQIEAFQQEMARGKWSGAGYGFSLTMALTLGGALAIQLNNIFQGKDPQPMNDPKFALAALQRGGGFGLFGDFMFQDLNRLGGGFGQALMGPTIGGITEVSKATFGNAQKAFQGKDTTIARDMIGLARRYTPILSSAWPVRAAYQRVALDQLQALADPNAHKSFREQEARFQREQGGTFWWPPGEAMPPRGPTLERLTK